MSTATHCAFCRQPFEPSEGKLQDQAGAFHPRCFGVHYKAGEPRRCAHCNDVIWAGHECIGSLGEGPTLHYHKACFVLAAVAQPKVPKEPKSISEPRISAAEYAEWWLRPAPKGRPARGNEKMRDSLRETLGDAEYTRIVLLKASHAEQDGVTAQTNDDRTKAALSLAADAKPWEAGKVVQAEDDKPYPMTIPGLPSNLQRACNWCFGAFGYNETIHDIKADDGYEFVMHGRCFTKCVEERRKARNHTPIRIVGIRVAKPDPAEPEAKAAPKVRELVVELKIDKAKAIRDLDDFMVEQLVVVRGMTRSEAQTYVAEERKRREAKAAREQRLKNLVMQLGIDKACLRDYLNKASLNLETLEKRYGELKSLVDSWDTEA